MTFRPRQIFLMHCEQALPGLLRSDVPPCLYTPGLNIASPAFGSFYSVERRSATSGNRLLKHGSKMKEARPFGSLPWRRTVTKARNHP